MKIRIIGCCQWTMEEIYSTVIENERENNYKIDLLLICGDYQAVWNVCDLHCMARPERFLGDIGSFHK